MLLYFDLSTTISGAGCTGQVSQLARPVLHAPTRIGHDLSCVLTLPARGQLDQAVGSRQVSCDTVFSTSRAANRYRRQSDFKLKMKSSGCFRTKSSIFMFYFDLSLLPVGVGKAGLLRLKNMFGVG